MTTVDIGKPSDLPIWPFPNLVHDLEFAVASRRLIHAFKRAKRIEFDNSTRFVFFSDCHRGDNGRADSFAKNKSLFLDALNHYFEKGFTYIEVGDGDELWENQNLDIIRRVHSQVFDLLHAFHKQSRLHLLIGNHDTMGRSYHMGTKDGLATEESLILQHKESGKSIYVVHGHQADFTGYRFYTMKRWFLRSVWKHLKTMVSHWQENALQQTSVWLFCQSEKVEQRIMQWAQMYRQPVICGHTHQPAFGGYQFASPNYFNTGSCINPGYLTGLEIEDGEIRLVKWVKDNSNLTGLTQRLLIAPPRALGSLD